MFNRVKFNFIDISRGQFLSKMNFYPAVPSTSSASVETNVHNDTSAVAVDLASPRRVAPPAPPPSPASSPDVLLMQGKNHLAPEKYNLTKTDFPHPILIGGPPNVPTTSAHTRRRELILILENSRLLRSNQRFNHEMQHYRDQLHNATMEIQMLKQTITTQRRDLLHNARQLRPWEFCPLCAQPRRHRTCPATGQRCRRCQGLGHFHYYCRATPQLPVIQVVTSPSAGIT